MSASSRLAPDRSVPTSTARRTVRVALWSGEEQLSVGEFGQYNRILADQFTNGMRKLVNAVEVDLAPAIHRLRPLILG